MKKLTVQFSFIVTLLFLCNTIFAQNFLYKREIKGIEKSNEIEWYKMKLPIGVIEKTNTDFSDIRIFGISDLDTLEAPFLIRKVVQKSENEEVSFKIINFSQKDNAYFFTLERRKKQRKINKFNKTKF